MEKNLNYEDNIFIINTNIRMISDLNLLETDPALFVNKTIYDLDFIGKTLTDLNLNLLKNTQLVDWADYLYKLYETEEKFLLLLRKILNEDETISVKKFPEIAGKIMFLIDECSSRISLLKEKMNIETVQTKDKHLVSTDELDALFA